VAATIGRMRSILKYAGLLLISYKGHPVVQV
jgi:hypothetical protein